MDMLRGVRFQDGRHMGSQGVDDGSIDLATDGSLAESLGAGLLKGE